MDELMKFDGKELSPEQADSLRRNKETKRVSMLGQFNENGKVKHSVIFKNTKQIFVYL